MANLFSKFFGIFFREHLNEHDNLLNENQQMVFN